ncbi:histone deacetylase complex subunit SAP30L isoform 2-T2 [Diretmus argenteus]|uniref:histone deacetylase complex subunit SAP30L isoform X2 n=1 Tax=Centroberyx affinis TaxID=166261 RepID=UPI003A5BF548
MNGFSTEEDSHDGPPAPPFYGQSCCLIEDGERCGRSAGNASFSKRIQKSISQKKLKLDIDKSVDLFQLQVNTLRRYKRHYKLQTRPGLNKAQLAETVSRHFRNIPVNEKETLTYFIYMVKSSKSRLDQKADGSKQLD